MALLQWRQGQQESCGAAALMVGLAELGPPYLSSDRESALWAKIRAEGAYGASLPGRIAIEVASQGSAATIWVDDEELNNATLTIGDAALFDVPSLISQHQLALEAAIAAGVQVVQDVTDAITLLDRMKHGARLMLAFAVPVEDGIVLHWRLYRQEAGSIWEMDPADGSNTPLTENQFHERLTQYIGAAVGIKRKPGPFSSASL